MVCFECQGTGWVEDFPKDGERVRYECPECEGEGYPSFDDEGEADEEE